MTGRPVRFISCARGVWGAENSMLLIAQQLFVAGTPVQLLCSSDEVERVWKERLPSSRVVRLGFSERAASSRLRTLLFFLLHFARFPPARGETQVIFSLDLAPMTLLRIFFGGRHFVLDLHDVPRSVLTRIVVFFAGCLCRRVICISLYIESYVHTRNSVVVNRPICLQGEAGELSSAVFTVGVVGRVDRIKRIELVVDAVALMKSNVAIEVRGEYFTEGDSYKSWLEAYGLQALGSGRVNFTGKLPLEELYSGLSVVVVANDQEPSGRTVGEAQAVGVPVVVPNAGGAAEYVTHGTTGLRYRARDASSLADQLSLLCGDFSLRRELGVAGRQSVASERGPERVGAEYLSAVRE